ncbi:MAG: STAS/SEC14 domain-containing protein [Bacteroidia bacterium]|nr:STAS/SEC14 domain-containing protein [Bacteroidia bacterium]
MHYHMDIPDHGTYVRVIVTGNITREFAGRYSVASKALADQHGLKRFLFDLRGARNVESTIQNYQYAYTDMPRFELDRLSRAAIIRDVDDHSHDFIELVARNAGYNVRIFVSEDTAIAWLQE